VYSGTWNNPGTYLRQVDSGAYLPKQPPQILPEYSMPITGAKRDLTKTEISCRIDRSNRDEEEPKLRKRTTLVRKDRFRAVNASEL
jgi:hypothetical protein